MACSDIGGCPKEIKGSSVGALIGADAAAFAGPDDFAGEAEPFLKGHGKESESGPVGCNSFSPDTSVLMGNGRTQKLKDIQIGDTVEAADPDTGKHQGPRSVTATHINHDTDLVDITVQTSSGRTATLHTTSNHLFWDDTTHSWSPAGKLAPGHALVTAHNTHVHVTAVRLVRGAADMYNLTVDQLHTYYVLAGATPILVHNTGCTITDETRTHMDRNHTEDGDLRDETKTVWGVSGAERDRAIRAALEDDPHGSPNTNGRTGTIHRGTMPDDIGDDGFIGRSADQDGGYPLDGVEVILNPDGSVRNSYPWAPGGGD